KVLGIASCVILLASAAGVRGQADIEPARFSDGSIPQRVSPLAAGGGDVMLSVAVSSAGAGGAIAVLRSTPPYTDTVVEPVKTRRLSPALDDKRKPLVAHVLVRAVVRA